MINNLKKQYYILYAQRHLDDCDWQALLPNVV